MNILPITTDQLVLVQNNEPMTTSKIIAEHFEKHHAHVLRDIQSLDCSEQFSRSNFGLSHYTNERNKSYPIYNISKDGFMFLVMGFTGKKAAEWKEAFIAEFNRMAEQINQQQQALTNQVIIDQQKLIALQDKQIKKMPRFWTDTEKQIAINDYIAGFRISVIAKKLDRSYNSTRHFIKRARRAELI